MTDVEFTDAELDFLKSQKKISSIDENSKALSNEFLKTDILLEMVSGKSYRISDIVKRFSCVKSHISPQKVSYLVNQLVKIGAVSKVNKKGVSWFSVID